tara:strand:- start:141 stop:431 length:291 start_codon:yes stop_codon:yes gene_type:complete
MGLLFLLMRKGGIDLWRDQRFLGQVNSSYGLEGGLPMAKEKACKQCKAIYEGAKCPKCGSTEGNEHFTGRVDVIDPKGELAKKIGVNEKGVYAIRS